MGTIRDSLVVEYDHEVATTRKLLERIPDDKLTWKPHEKSRSCASIATHLGTIPAWGRVILCEPFVDLAGVNLVFEPKTSREDILTLFDDSTKQTRAIMDKTDAEYQAMWALKRGGQEMFSMPRVSAFRTFVLYHMVHHRGQLCVYLRVNEVPIPAIYGPSADEG